MSGSFFRPHPAVMWEKVSDCVVIAHHESGLVQHLSPAHSLAFLGAIHGGQAAEYSQETCDLEAAGLIVRHNQAPTPPRRSVVSGMAAGAVLAALWLPSRALASSTPEPTLIDNDLSSANWKWASGSGGFSVISFADLADFDGGTLFVIGESWVINILSFGEGLTATAQVTGEDPRTLGFDITSDTLPTGAIQARISQADRNLVSSPFTIAETPPAPPA